MLNYVVELTMCLNSWYTEPIFSRPIGLRTGEGCCCCCRCDFGIPVCYHFFRCVLQHLLIRACSTQYRGQQNAIKIKYWVAMQLLKASSARVNLS